MRHRLAERLHRVRVESGDSRTIDKVAIFDKHPYLQAGEKDRNE